MGFNKRHITAEITPGKQPRAGKMKPTSRAHLARSRAEQHEHDNIHFHSGDKAQTQWERNKKRTIQTCPCSSALATKSYVTVPMNCSLSLPLTLCAGSSDCSQRQCSLARKDSTVEPDGGIHLSTCLALHVGITEVGRTPGLRPQCIVAREQGTDKPFESGVSPCLASMVQSVLECAPNGY